MDGYQSHDGVKQIKERGEGEIERLLGGGGGEEQSKVRWVFMERVRAMLCGLWAKDSVQLFCGLCIMSTCWVLNSGYPDQVGPS